VVDRVYRRAIPELRKQLEEMRREFARLDSGTDWVRLRVDPVLRHARELERRLTSPQFAKESARLTKGVALFHSDLVYLRTNVVQLRRLLPGRQQKRTR
jgi:hypothetical protein